MTRRRQIDQSIVQPTEAAAAFHRLTPQFLKLTKGELQSPNLDTPWATTLVRGVAPRLVAYREEIHAKLPTHPLEYVDHLVDYALAAWQGYIQNLPPATKDQVDALLAQAVPLRARVLDGADGLAHGGLVSSEAVDEIRAGSGLLDTATDLSQLAVLLTTNWSAIHNKTYITLDEVHRCGQLGSQLHAALAERDHAKPSAESADLRVRSFTLFVRVYDENRRAMSYLRWHEGDLDEILPSLYAHGGGPSHKRPAAAPSAGGTAASGSTTGTTTPSSAASASATRGGPFTQDPEPTR